MKYIRDKDKVMRAIAKDSEGRRIAKAPLRIHTPVRFVEKGLSAIGLSTYVYGAFPIIMEDGSYLVSNICGRIKINPTQTKIITIDDVDYYEFYFDKDSVIFPTNRVVQDDKIIFFVLDELVFLAKVPWYLGYDDMCNILSTAKEYADFGGATVQEIVEVFGSIIARPKSNHDKFLRLTAKTPSDFLADKIQYVPMESVYLSVPGTVNRISGSHFEPAIEGALTQPSKTVDNLQRILRA